MNGDGILLRDPGKLPPSARKQLEKIGNEKITKIVAVRTPLSSTTKTFLNIISLGQFEKISKKYFDELFHLAFWINDKYNLEKNEVIAFGTKNPIKSDSETQSITINKNLTFNELMENTRKYMGDNNFTAYNAEKNNCQNFLLGILNGNGIGTDAEKKWIKQDTEQVFKEVPTFAKVLGNIATTAGAVVNRLVEGEGLVGGATLEQIESLTESQRREYITRLEQHIVNIDNQISDLENEIKDEINQLQTIPFSEQAKRELEDYIDELKGTLEELKADKETSKELIRKLKMRGNGFIGEGRPRRLYMTDDGRYYYMKAGKKRFIKMPAGISQKQVVKINLGNLVKPKKKRKRKAKKRIVKAEILPGSAVGKFGPPPVIAKIEKEKKLETGEIIKTVEGILKLVPREPTKISEPPLLLKNKHEDISEEQLRTDIQSYFNEPAGDKSSFNNFLVRYLKNKYALGDTYDEELVNRDVSKFRKNTILKEFYNTLLNNWKSTRETIPARTGRIYTPSIGLPSRMPTPPRPTVESPEFTVASSSTNSSDSSSNLSSISNESEYEGIRNRVFNYLFDRFTSKDNEFTRLPSEVEDIIEDEIPVNKLSDSYTKQIINRLKKDIFEREMYAKFLRDIGFDLYADSFSGSGVENPTTCYNPLSIAFSNMPIGLEVGNSTIKTEAFSTTTTPTTQETKKEETKKEETQKSEKPQKPEEPQKGQGLFSDVVGVFNPTLGMSTRVLGYGFGMAGGCNGMSSCQCGNGSLGDMFNDIVKGLNKRQLTQEEKDKLDKLIQSRTKGGRFDPKRDVIRNDEYDPTISIEEFEQEEQDRLRIELEDELDNLNSMIRNFTTHIHNLSRQNTLDSINNALQLTQSLREAITRRDEIRNLLGEGIRGGADPEEEPEPTEELDLQDEIELIDEEMDNLGREYDEIQARIERLRVSLRSWGRTSDTGPTNNMFVRGIRQELSRLIERQQEIVEDIENLVELRQQRVDALRGGGEDVDGLYNDEIETIADNLGIKVPVIASDEVDKIVNMINPSTKEFGFIINTDNSKGAGKHWRSIFIDNDEDRPSIEYFDSLGNAPESQLVEDMKKIVDKLDNEKYFLFKENMIKRQADDTNTCGHFALKFLEDRFNGVPWAEATGFKKCINQSGIGEKEISKSVKKYENYL